MREKSYCVFVVYKVLTAFFFFLNPYATSCITYLLKEGGPLSGPQTGLLSNTQKWIVRGDTSADKARDFIGKGHLDGEQ